MRRSGGCGCGHSHRPRVVAVTHRQQGRLPNSVRQAFSTSDTPFQRTMLDKHRHSVHIELMKKCIAAFSVVGHAAAVSFGVAVCESVYDDSYAQGRCSVGRDDASHVD